jgi:apurinic endonuclease APN1
MMGVHMNDFQILSTVTESEINPYDKKLLEKSNIIQVFVANLDYVNKIKGYNGKYIVHASYTINLARNWDEYSVHVNQFIKEITLAHKLHADGIVVHMGKQLELTIEDAYNNMYSCLLYIHQQTKKDSNIPIYLETSTGQGSETCYKIEDYAYFYKKLVRHKNKEISDRFRLCVDTCHIFAAGYDLTSESSIKMYLEAFEELIGIRYINLIHLNDSKNELGSNVDRHENIGQGHIGKDSLKYIASYFKNINVPIILETPYENILDDLEYISS